MNQELETISKNVRFIKRAFGVMAICAVITTVANIVYYFKYQDDEQRHQLIKTNHH